MALLEMQNVTLSFGGLVALDNVNLEVAEGELIGLIGPNGAGKTTLFNAVTGYVAPNKGKILFNGEDVAHLSPHRICRKGIARTFQLGKHFPYMTALENVMVGAYSRTNSKLKARQESDDVLKFLGLYEKKDVLTVNLTLAERKFTELGRALATKPRLLLLDEIMAGLNPVEVENAKRIIGEVRKMGITVIIVEHIMAAVMTLSDSVVVLSHGAVTAKGTPEEVCNNDAVIQAYLGEKWTARRRSRNA